MDGDIVVCVTPCVWCWVGLLLPSFSVSPCAARCCLSWWAAVAVVAFLAGTILNYLQLFLAITLYSLGSKYPGKLWGLGPFHRKRYTETETLPFRFVAP